MICMVIGKVQDLSIYRGYWSARLECWLMIVKCTDQFGNQT
jgi:hypothetical protein